MYGWIRLKGKGEFPIFCLFYNDLEFISNYGVPININDCNLVVMQVKLHETDSISLRRKSCPKSVRRVNNLPETLLLPVSQCLFWSCGERDALLNLER